MGCDIHLYVEAKVKGEWKFVYGPHPYMRLELDFSRVAKEYKMSAEEVANQVKSLRPTFEPTDAAVIYEGKKLPIYDEDDWLYPYRDYTLFGFLAGLRDDTLDCIMGDNYDENLRGFPKDASEELKEIYGFEEMFDGYGCWHSGNWLTYKELLEFDLNKTANVAAEKYIRIKDYTNCRNNPDQVYDPNDGMVYPEGTNLVGTIINVEQANEIIDTCHKNKTVPATSQWSKDMYVKVYLGKIAYKYYLKDFYGRLKILDGFAEPENIRLVYWFDN